MHGCMAYRYIEQGCKDKTADCDGRRKGLRLVERGSSRGSWTFAVKYVVITEVSLVNR
jgi:hypothetical protein